jgi:uncharacterized membrane protein YraQ (UPF0718 family)
MWQAAQTIFLSIVLESLPFVLLGVLLSSLIQQFVTQEQMVRWLPRNKGLAVAASSLLGMAVPICDCGTMPVARSLMQKGVPAAAAMAFLMAAPVVNPVTMAATYVAFGMDAKFMWLRTAATLCIAMLIGWLLLYLEAKKSLHQTHVMELSMHETAVSNAIMAEGVSSIKPKRSIMQVAEAVIGHAITEFFEIMGFVVISAAVAAVLQTFVPASVVGVIGEHPIWSVLAMMALSILFSLCSSADAFVARSLAGLSTTGGVVGFLVVGQMIDIRNLFLLPRVFSRKTVIITFVMAFVLTLLLGVGLNFI